MTKDAEIKWSTIDNYKVIKPPGEDPLIVDGCIKCRYSMFCSDAINGVFDKKTRKWIKCDIPDGIAITNCPKFEYWNQKLTKVVKLGKHMGTKSYV